MTPLSFAARRGDIETVKALLATQTIIVNSLNEQKYTPLLWAVEIGNLTVVKQLERSWYNPTHVCCKWRT